MLTFTELTVKRQHKWIQMKTTKSSQWYNSTQLQVQLYARGFRLSPAEQVKLYGWKSIGKPDVNIILEAKQSSKALLDSFSLAAQARP